MLITELHERLKKYREHGKQYEKEEIKAFRMAIGRGLYPEKCLVCFKAGLRFCRFWNSGFNCETVEREEQIRVFTEKIEALL